MLLSKAFRFLPQASITTRGMSSIVNKNQADVVILGGGMVGSSLACAMAASPYFEGRKICLLEGAPKKQFTLSEGYSNRVSFQTERNFKSEKMSATTAYF